MIKVRRGVFETNSSSTHSVTLSENFDLDTSIVPDEEGFLYVPGDCFGWENMRTSLGFRKLSYAATATLYNGPEFLLTLEQVIKDVTGAVSVVFLVDANSHYIDHESVNECPTTYQELKNFIFNKNSWLITGNDNQSYPFNYWTVSQEPVCRIVFEEGSGFEPVQVFSEVDDWDVFEHLDSTAKIIIRNGERYKIERVLEGEVRYINTSFRPDYRNYKEELRAFEEEKGDKARFVFRYWKEDV